MRTKRSLWGLNNEAQGVGKALWVVLAVLMGSSLPVQNGPDFTGRWIRESPSPAPDTPRALSTEVRTNIRGEPMRPFFKDITIERQFESTTRSETHQIGVGGGMVPGLGQMGRPTAHGSIMPLDWKRTPSSSRAAATQGRVRKPAFGQSAPRYGRSTWMAGFVW